MKLNDQTDYALRVLIYLGTHSGRRPSTSEIAEAFGISRHHLSKVVTRLAELGYTRTQRGRGGGLVLGREPEDINVGTVVDEIESHFDLVECFREEDNACPIAGVCALTPMLRDAELAFHDTLARYTLADVLRGRRRALLRKRLGGS